MDSKSAHKPAKHCPFNKISIFNDKKVNYAIHALRNLRHTDVIMLRTIYFSQSRKFHQNVNKGIIIRVYK